jgi:hypothetical protein
MTHVRSALCVLLMLLASAGMARAQVPLLSTGPSVSFGRLGFERDLTNPRVDKPNFRFLTAGAGWTLRINPPKLVSADGRIAYMSWDATALVQLTTLPVAGGLSVATGPSFYNGLVGLQVGAKLFEFSQDGPAEGLLALAGGRRNLFFLVSLSTNLLFDRNNSTAKEAKTAMNTARPNYMRVF